MNSLQASSLKSSEFKIAVVGGGLGGLTLASVLQYAYNIKCTVFELDSTAESRPQGGSLDLHVGSGLLAMEKTGLFEEFQKHARYLGLDMVIADKTGKVHHVHVGGGPTGGDDERPEIDRTILRQILIDSLDESIIQWGKKVVSIEEESKDSDNHRHILTFQGGQTGTFDLVVGADGAWSKIRKLVSEANPFYTGVSMVEACLSNVDIDHPAASKLVGHGIYSALQNNKALLCQRNGDGTIRVYITLRIEENGLSHLDGADPEFTRQYLLEKFSDWDDSLMTFIKDSKTYIPRRVYILPTDHTWKTHPGVTLIGDAAHLMTPFAGEGANMAMLDGVNLAAAISEIVNNGKDLTTTIEAFEKDMHNIVTGPATESAQNIDFFISEEAPQPVVDFFEKMQHAGGPPPS
ncbi:monooxygenase FAD-binding protein [Umbelopsis sp. PMI_123]|nr:monooxygenase FAD-binding protein [Umbelopsis sp. PMI_123]